MRRLGSLSIGLCVVFAAELGRADPQWNGSLLTGLGGMGAGGRHFDELAWVNALRGDVLLLRQRNADVGLGPYVDVATAGFRDVRFGGGASLLLPVHPYVPIIVSGGGYAVHSSVGWRPGVAGWLYVGSRSYNYHSAYGMSGGLMLGYQQNLGDPREHLVVIAAQIDLESFVLGSILVYEVLRGAPDDE